MVDVPDEEVLVEELDVVPVDDVPLPEGLCAGHVPVEDVELLEEELLGEVVLLDDVVLEDELVVEDDGRVVVLLVLVVEPVPEVVVPLEDAWVVPLPDGLWVDDVDVAEAASAARSARIAGVDSGRRCGPAGTRPVPSSAGWVPSR